MNALSSTIAVSTASGGFAGATRGHYASTFFYPGYAYVYFPTLAGDT